MKQEYIDDLINLGEIEIDPSEFGVVNSYLYNNYKILEVYHYEKSSIFSLENGNIFKVIEKEKP